MTNPGIAIDVEAGDWPPEPALRNVAVRAVGAAVEALRGQALSPPTLRGTGAPEVSILFTDDAAMRKLNEKWRGKDSPTNVLSFPQAQGQLLGDIVLSAETVRREAALADKPLEDHMAHLIIHAYLHLLGFDHEAEADAGKMEQLERVALKKLGLDDPYAALPRE
jgi:probable rRNA maturation factor